MLLLKNGIQAKLIQSNEGFSLYNLVEVRFLLNKVDVGADVYSISDEVWENAKRELIIVFHNSNKLEICPDIIKDFEITNPYKKYKSDLEVLIRESKHDDFCNHNGETIFVSAKVNFVLYWLKEGASQEIKIILPELYFEKLIN